MKIDNNVRSKVPRISNSKGHVPLEILSCSSSLRQIYCGILLNDHCLLQETYLYYRKRYLLTVVNYLC